MECSFFLKKKNCLSLWFALNYELCIVFVFTILHTSVGCLMKMEQLIRHEYLKQWVLYVIENMQILLNWFIACLNFFERARVVEKKPFNTTKNVKMFQIDRNLWANRSLLFFCSVLIKLLIKFFIRKYTESTTAFSINKPENFFLLQIEKPFNPFWLKLDKCKVCNAQDNQDEHWKSFLSE